MAPSQEEQQRKASYDLSAARLVKKHINLCHWIILNYPERITPDFLYPYVAFIELVIFIKVLTETATTANTTTTTQTTTTTTLESGRKSSLACVQ